MYVRKEEANMPSKNFRIGLVFTPSSVISVGVLNSNQKEAYEFIGQIQPLIDEFMDRVREECRAERRQSQQERL